MWYGLCRDLKATINEEAEAIDMWVGQLAKFSDVLYIVKWTVHEAPFKLSMAPHRISEPQIASEKELSHIP